MLRGVIVLLLLVGCDGPDEPRAEPGVERSAYTLDESAFLSLEATRDEPLVGGLAPIGEHVFRARRVGTAPVSFALVVDTTPFEVVPPVLPVTARWPGVGVGAAPCAPAIDASLGETTISPGGGDCLTVGERTTEVIGYRAPFDRSRLPFDAHVDGLVVTLSSRDGTPPPDAIRVRSGVVGHDLAAAASVTTLGVLSDPAVEGDAAHSLVEGFLSRAVGLDTASWRARITGERMPFDALYFRLSAADVDRLGSLDLTPPPDATTRSFLVQVVVHRTSGVCGASAGGFHGRPTAIARVHTGTIVADGGLDRESVRRALRRHLDEMRECYAAALADRPELAGRVTLGFDVEADGTVTGTRVSHASTLDDDAVESCLVASVAAVRFPALDPPARTAVLYPVSFDSSGE